MIFWIEGDIEITYDRLIEDLQNDTQTPELPGYMYFLKLVKKLSKNAIIKSIGGLKKHLIKN